MSPTRLAECVCACMGDAVPTVPVAAWACGVGGLQGGHPDIKGQLSPGAPSKLQAGRSRGHPQGVGLSSVLRLWGMGVAARGGMGLWGWIPSGLQHQEPLGNP